MEEQELNELRKLAEGGANALPDAEEAEDKETPTEDSQTKEEVETEVEGDESEETSSSKKDDVEEARVPYSRFETVNERAIRAEKELELLREEQKQSKQVTVSETDPPAEWLELYGDSDTSRRAWNVQQTLDQKRLASIQEAAARSAVEGLEKRQAEQSKHESEIVSNMENAFDDFAAKNKRTFSDSEQSAILDVMDDLSPKDEKGLYLVDPTTYMERAVELYDLRLAKSTTKKNESKRRATSLASAGSEGEPSNQKTGHFKAGSWDSWRDSPLLPKD